MLSTNVRIARKRIFKGSNWQSHSSGVTAKAHCPLIAEMASNGDSYRELRNVFDSFQKRLYRSLVVVLG